MYPSVVCHSWPFRGKKISPRVRLWPFISLNVRLRDHPRAEEYLEFHILQSNPVALLVLARCTFACTSGSSRGAANQCSIGKADLVDLVPMRPTRYQHISGTGRGLLHIAKQPMIGLFAFMVLAGSRPNTIWVVLLAGTSSAFHE